MVQSEEHAQLEARSLEDVEAAPAVAVAQPEDEDEEHAVTAEAKLLDNGNAAHCAKEAKAKLKREKSVQDRQMTEEINKLLDDMPLEKNVACGFWLFRGAFFQR